jgi:hypothetical protein
MKDFWAGLGVVRRLGQVRKGEARANNVLKRIGWRKSEIGKLSL